jgi:hypothetical protein
LGWKKGRQEDVLGTEKGIHKNAGKDHKLSSKMSALKINEKEEVLVRESTVKKLWMRKVGQMDLDFKNKVEFKM